MENLRDRLKQHEGLYLVPYKDSEGFWSIGWGHKLTSTYGPRIRKLFGAKIEKLLAFRLHKPDIELSEVEAEELLTEDLYAASDKFMRWKGAYCPQLNLTRSEACVELIFWVGYTGFLKFDKMIKAMENKDYKLAALELYNSKLGKKYSSRTKTLAVLMWEGRMDG